MIGIGRPTPHSFLTALSPVEYRDDDPENRIADIRRELAAHDPLDSPFADCPMVHMARLQVIDRMTPRQGDRSGSRLQSTYLLFVVELDGEIPDFVDRLYRKRTDWCHAVWGRCIDYPRYRGEVFFRRFIRRSTISNALPYAGFELSMPDTLRALTRQQLFAAWAARAQSMSDAERQASWRELRRTIAAPGTLRPGALQFVAGHAAAREEDA